MYYQKNSVLVNECCGRAELLYHSESRVNVISQKLP